MNIESSKSKKENSYVPKCLIVDDLKENVLALSILLNDMNLEIHTANSGPEALDLLLENDYVVSLIDVHMPEMDGLELAELMRGTQKTKGIPIIFVTAANTDEQHVFQGYEAGAVDFLQKPLRKEVVASKVKIFIELYHQKRQLELKIEELRKTEQELTEALRSRDEFLSLCSHELKSPLTSLKLNIELTEERRKKHGEESAYSIDKMKKFHELSGKNVRRLLRLVDDILDASRVAGNSLQLVAEEVNLHTLLEDVLDRLAPILETSHNDLGVNLEVDIFIKADRFRIEQVLTNLLVNVSKYAPDCKVEVESTHQNGFARIKIKDKGPGISTEEQSKIFDRYHRVTDKDHVTGLGLGLYIAKEIIGMHNGSISVESKLGEGSTFEVRIPCTCHRC